MKTPLTQSIKRWWWVAALVACYLVFLDRGLNEPDEGRYAELGREMAEGGDWLTPHLNGIPHFQKPPLLYWCVAACVKTLGPHAWAARLPSMAAALGTLALTAWLAGMLFGPHARSPAALVLGSVAGFFAMGRLLTPDMMLTFWVTAAVACIVRRHRGGGSRWGWAFFAAMGVGFLTKGPMALVVPLCATIALRRATPRAERPALPWFAGLALTLALGLSWFVALSVRDPALFRYFAGDELVKRFASSSHGRSKPWWFFLAVLPLAFLPWAAWLPALGREAWRRWRLGQPLGSRNALLLGWTLPPFLILSVSGSKLPTYILPLAPAWALGVAGWWLARGWSPAMLRRIAAGTLVVCVAFAALMEPSNDMLKQQADTRELAELALAQPDSTQATFFAARVRAQGFAFATRRLLCVTESEADVVLPPTAEQAARLFEDVAALEKAMAARPAAYGLARRGDVPRNFPPDRWRVLAMHGDFVLVGRSRVTPPAPAANPAGFPRGR